MAENAPVRDFREVHSHRPTVPADGGPMRIKIIGKPPILKTIVPVIFIPGIFGSRLEKAPAKDKNAKGAEDNKVKGTDDDKGKFVWDPNRMMTLIGNYAKGATSMFAERYWDDDEIYKKTLRMHGPAAVMKDLKYGKEDVNASVIDHIVASPTFSRLRQQYDQKTMTNNVWDGRITYSDLAKKVAQEEYDRRCARGWYGVWNSYDPLLETIHELSDPEFIYPVYAFGYDWRNDLKDAADELVTKIKNVRAIDNYPDFGEADKDYKPISCNATKVIIVTHSQGSLVARYAMKVLGVEGQVQAVVHMDQPTTGAPALYRRFITGTGPERELLGLEDKVFGAVLGNNSYHFTSMAAPLIGALSLLPTNDYVAKQGDAKHQWFCTVDPKLKFSKPIADVYTDVYLGEGEEKNEKWSLIGCKRYDAAGQPKPYQEKEFEIVRDLVSMEEYPRFFYEGKPLPLNAEILPAPADNPYRQDNHRLRPHVGLDRETLTKAADYWSEFSIKIEKAKAFHAKLKLDQHTDTHVVRSRGVDTVTQVTFSLNDRGLLECPLVRTENGDGTVPLTSQEALLQTAAKPAGKIIQGGKHAEICTHPEAMKQVMDLLRGSFVDALRDKPQSKQA